MTRKLLLIFVFLIGFSSLKSHAQRIMGEAFIGLNMSKVEGDLVNNGSFKFQKPGLNVGVGALVPISPYFSINLQTQFTQKGAYKKYGSHPDSAMPYYHTKLDYAEVPLLVNYHDKRGLTMGTGFSYSRLVRVKWVVNGRTISSSLSDGYYARDNVDWIADFKYKIYEDFLLNIRYQYGLTSIWSGSNDDLLITQDEEKQSSDQRHSLISFRVVWVFGGKQSKEVIEKID